MSEQVKLDYVEFAASDLEKTKRFFSAAFNWSFQDYGEEYTAFENQGLNGGFYRAELSSTAASGGALLVFYSPNIEATYKKVVDNKVRLFAKFSTFPAAAAFILLSLVAMSLPFGLSHDNRQAMGK
ncbi:glyoxalase family protein [Vibrio maritimus]|uniref:Glyoxalase family protein n=1 Tax=Vibrio maritimus TaxID=990268 RepID=A0A090TB90_9VIBR|nr:glyoxalase family protein [Vibrio maritimus]